MRKSQSPSDEMWANEQFRVQGRSVHYRRSLGGSGVPIVHVHGFGISGSYLMPTARLLADRWVNVVPDLPGYGRSERRDHVLGIPALAEALIAVLDHLHFDQAVLVGVVQRQRRVADDLGGAAGQVFALRGEPDAPADPLDELGAGLGFQPGQMMADSGLGVVQVLGGLGDRALRGDRRENP